MIILGVMKQSFGSLQGVIWGLMEIIYIIEESLECRLGVISESLEINRRVIKDSFGYHHGVIRDSLKSYGESLESH